MCNILQRYKGPVCQEGISALNLVIFLIRVKDILSCTAFVQRYRQKEEQRVHHTYKNENNSGKSYQVISISFFFWMYYLPLQMGKYT